MEKQKANSSITTLKPMRWSMFHAVQTVDSNSIKHTESIGSEGNGMNVPEHLRDIQKIWNRQPKK
jgi:hypothetical protein